MPRTLAWRLELPCLLLFSLDLLSASTTSGRDNTPTCHFRDRDSFRPMALSPLFACLVSPNTLELGIRQDTARQQALRRAMASWVGVDVKELSPSFIHNSLASIAQFSLYRLEITKQ